MWDEVHTLNPKAKLDVLSTHQDFLVGFPVQEEESVQLGVGSAVYTTSHALGRDCLVGYVNVAPQISVNLLLNSDWVNTLIPLPGLAEMFCNGWQVQQTNIVMMGNDDGYTTTGHGRNNLFLTARISKLQEAIAAVSGLHLEDVRLRDQSIDLTSPEMDQLRRMVLDVLNLSAAAPEIGGHPRIDQAREGYLLSFYAMLLAKRALGFRGIKSSKKSALQVVRTVETSWRDLSMPPSIADMCMTAGVSERHLRDCFYEVYGVSPARHAKLRRLSAARRMLLNRDNRPSSVKFVALSNGFAESGRFAQDYRKLFGETPKQTMGGLR